MNVNKLEALTFFYRGKSKTSICKKFKIKPRLLNKWIRNDNTTVKEVAQNMYYFKVPKEEICDCLYLKPHVLNNWIEETFRDIANHALNKDVKLYRKQDGYSFWVENILNVDRIS